MDLADEYRAQLAWRGWPAILAALPLRRGDVVLDLGCGVGDLAAELAARGASVVGIDSNEELLAAARARGIAGATFLRGDLTALPSAAVPASGAGAANGIWNSFACAYFVDLAPVLAQWRECLRPGGWIALTEIDGLFAHEPLAPRTRELLAAYAADALAAGRYDFAMGRRLEEHLRRAGFSIVRTLELPDLEFAFDGPARPDVLDGWRRRLDRMGLLRAACGEEFEALRADFLGCLARPDHRSRCRVRGCIARS